ncbi:Low specificity L-threonine aldolase [Fundidesulfovibrio magnetotacticus]|uniref:Low specificity L-threonine aldolase n=1 Tax=Fundidesulfovibrio magnetotacticus TaxID=2730080 RepID=A0A6V8LSM6_9BACT|nr:aminotransferase class V-fold PLP-dependent enzyme [Fundidesulfovibrio magnetotacticus]GFK93318.1 Low specificity L-threonine aldolase [Fundidesulfovibrio magnetotacticus]
MPSRPGFASDNNSGVHPLILEAMARANDGHAVAYGDDPWTEAALEAFDREFGPGASVHFVFLGTAANVLALQAMTRPHNAVVCARTAHINVDECGAPERHLGCKLLAQPTADGLLDPQDLRRAFRDFGNPHHNQPRAVSITQATELGTLYRPEQVRELARIAHENDMLLHMDGARIANAAAALDLTLAQATRALGVDALSFGGTKNGMMYGEAVVFFKKDLGREFPFIRKQGMQLASKMRFVAAQFSALLQDGLWRANASNANAMAALLAREAASVPGVEISKPVETNAVFARIPARAVEALRREFFFYTWNAEPEDMPEVRWMCSFDTTAQAVEQFVAALRKAMTA